MLFFSVLFNLAHAQIPLNCSKNLIEQASEAFPDNDCHLGMQEPGGFAVFCNQRVDGVLTDTEVPIFIGLDPYRFKEVSEADRPHVWAFLAQGFMHLSNTDFIEVIGTEKVCEGPNVTWWQVETHLPLQDYSRNSGSSGSRRL